MRARAPLFGLLAALAACHPNDDGPPPPDTETDADTDADTDSDTDADTDSDSDTDADTDTDSDPGLPLGADCDPGADACAVGTGCCTVCCAADATPVCTALDEFGGCPLPDLSVDGDVLAASWYVTSEEVPADSCAVVEGCVADSGWRKLLRFTTTTPNLGTGDLSLGIPSEDPDRFTYSACHGHYHFLGYMEYALLDSAGTAVATGRKQAFCLMDSDPYADDAHPPRYHCGDQGLTVGWADTYSNYLDCQWLDVTDVAPGDYTLRLTVDPDGLLRERDTTNNVSEVAVTVLADDADVTQACDPAALGEDRDCGWSDAGNFTCTPGEPITLGCDGECAGTCTGDPVLRVCDATTPDCTAVEALGSNDDSCGSACSALEFTCPAGGEVQALLGAWESDLTASCTLTTW